MMLGTGEELGITDTGTFMKAATISHSIL